MRIAAVVMVSLWCGCQPSSAPREVHGLALGSPPPSSSPCSARNPIRLLDVLAERSTGAPRDDVFRFALPAATDVCLRIANPAIDGHRVTAAWLTLDAEPLLDPSDFTQTFEGVSVGRALPAGEHSFQVRVASKPGTRVVIQVEVAGPIIDSFSPQYAATGTRIVLSGEGFVGPVTVTSGDVVLALPVVGSASVVGVTTVANMPVGPLTITTPYGSATSAGSFVPADPRGLVPFYPMSDFELGEGTCSGQAHLLVRQDGARMGFVVEDPGPNAAVSLDIDDDNDQSTVENTLVATEVGHLAVMSATFAALDLHSHVKLGRLNLRVRTAGPCGVRVSSWFDLKSALAPGLVIVKTPQPQAVANRHGLTVASVEGELALMTLPTTIRLEDLLVALASDPDSFGAIPDNVLYGASHADRNGCAPITGPPVRGPLLDPGPGGLAQWTLGRIGIDSPLSAVTGAGIVVAVLDTGFDPSHADLAGVALPGVDVTIFGDGTTADLNPGRHGTGVASVIAATQGNGGMVGIAPGARIFPIRVLGRTGASEGFGLHRALTAVATARAAGVNIQVVNVSMAEFTDTLLIVGGVLTRLAGLYQASAPAILAGLVLRTIIRERVSSTIAAGVAVVAAAGNFGDTVLAIAGTQFPANSPGVFAVAATDETNRVVPSSMRATGGNRIALSAPSEVGEPDGGSTGGTVAVGSGATGGAVVGCLGGSTSFAAPHMSGAIASILAPAPPLTPAATNGVLAGLRLIATATPLADPPEAAGAGLLNLSLAQLPEYRWSLAFDSFSGRIDDFAFLPSVGDFALRGLGGTIETITDPTGTATSVATLPSAAAWMNAVPSASQLILGTATGVELWLASGTLVSTRPLSSFRAAVSSRTSAGGELILLSSRAGGVQLFRGAALSPVRVVFPQSASETFIDAHWASDPQQSGFEIFAARTEARIEFFRVPTAIGGDCRNETAGCPVRLGSVRLAVDASDGTSQPVAPLDWTATVEAGGATAYVVDGSPNFFFGGVGTALTPTLIMAGASYEQIESGPVSGKVYAADLQQKAFATLQNRALLTFDRTAEGIPVYLGTTLRLAPNGTYAYMASSLATGPGSMRSA